LGYFVHVLWRTGLDGLAAFVTQHISRRLRRRSAGGVIRSGLGWRMMVAGIAKTALPGRLKPRDQGLPLTPVGHRGELCGLL
jgi:hypothetical protein